MRVEPVVLEGDRVRLEPMRREHLDALTEAGKYDELWQWTRAKAGAVEEGVLRRHILTHSGRFRDTIYYSILDHEWPALRARLEGRLRRT